MDKIININTKLEHELNKLYNEIERFKIKNINLTNNLESTIIFNKQLTTENVRLKNIIRSKL
jgi:hypothetical protein